MLLQQAMLDVPQLLGKIHIILVRIVEPFHLVPEGFKLSLAVVPDFLDRRCLIDALAVLEDRDQQLAGCKVLQGLPFPGRVRIKNLQRPAAVDLLVKQAELVRNGLAGFILIQPVDFLEMRVGDLGRIFADLDFRDQFPLLLHGSFWR